MEEFECYNQSWVEAIYSQSWMSIDSWIPIKLGLKSRNSFLNRRTKYKKMILSESRLEHYKIEIDLGIQWFEMSETWIALVM